jgi:hypothetical protein
MTQKKPLFTIDSLAEFALVHQSPCLPLYQPTHRCSPENQQDPIRFGNLVKKLEASSHLRISFIDPGRCSYEL